ncbi:DDE-type integrase/transposase/recombinase [Streptomyces sp. NPDC055134]
MSVRLTWRARLLRHAPPPVVPEDPPRRPVSRASPRAAGLISQEAVSELRVVTVGIEQRVRAMRLIEHGTGRRLFAPAVVGLPGELEDPARDRDGNPACGPDPRAALRPDLVVRNFAPDGAGLETRWCGDITCVPTDEGWLCLATVIDIASRRVVGWATSDHLWTGLVADALRSACQQRRLAHRPAAPPPAPSGEVHQADEGQNIGGGSDHSDFHAETSLMPCCLAPNFPSAGRVQERATAGVRSEPRASSDMH